VMVECSNRALRVGSRRPDFSIQSGMLADDEKVAPEWRN
jgi:hypothetical protein